MIHDQRMDRRQKSPLDRGAVSHFSFGFLFDGQLRLGKGRVFTLRIATATARRKGCMMKDRAMSEEVAEVEQPDVNMTDIFNWIISAGVHHG